jgi:hypothetical protein
MRWDDQEHDQERENDHYHRKGCDRIIPVTFPYVYSDGKTIVVESDPLELACVVEVMYINDDNEITYMRG